MKATKTIKKLVQRHFNISKSKGMMYQAKKYSQLLDIKPITKEQKAIVKSVWGEIVDNISDGYLSYDIFNTVAEFNPNYVPREYYHPYIMETLNRRDCMYVLSDKSMAYTYFKGLNLPKLVIFASRGVILNSNFEVLSIDEAARYLADYQKDMIIKISTDSGHGYGVQKIDTSLDYDTIKAILVKFNNNYIVQEIIGQSESTKVFNPTSLNTIRIFTLYINGRFSVLGQMLKCGAQGQFVDNAFAGSSFVKIYDDGMLEEFGQNYDGVKMTSLNGYKFAGHKVANIEGVFKLVEEGHKRINAVGLVGWDIALDDKDEPMIIEANLFRPGSLSFQLSNGPMFGDRTQEVIDYVKKYRNKTRILY